jgi:hypothetical protein
MKGRMITGQVLSSNYGGWQFNEYWDVEQTYDDPNDFEPPETIRRRRLPDETGMITEADLITNPFFKPGPVELYSANGSSYASPQQHRNTLLAEMIPALSFAAGSNRLESRGEDRNFDMMSLKNGWPQDRLSQNNPNWLHSDFKTVAHLYTYRVLMEIVQLADLDQ